MVKHSICNRGNSSSSLLTSNILVPGAGTVGPGDVRQLRRPPVPVFKNGTLDGFAIRRSPGLCPGT